MNLSYKELQKAAREIGIKPQQKKEKLVKLLTASAASAVDGDDCGGPNSDYVTARKVRDRTPAEFIVAVQKEYFAFHSVYGPCILDFKGSKTCPVGSISIRYGVDGAKQMMTKNVTISHVAINMTWRSRRSRGSSRTGGRHSRWWRWPQLQRRLRWRSSR